MGSDCFWARKFRSHDTPSPQDRSPCYVNGQSDVDFVVEMKTALHCSFAKGEVCFFCCLCIPTDSCDAGYADCRKDVAPYAMVERLLEKEQLACALLCSATEVSDPDITRTLGSWLAQSRCYAWT